MLIERAALAGQPRAAVATWALLILAASRVDVKTAA
jgi:hypothetical protein